MIELVDGNYKSSRLGNYLRIEAWEILQKTMQRSHNRMKEGKSGEIALSGDLTKHKVRL